MGTGHLRTVADLEVCGLSPRAIEILDRAEIIWIDQFKTLTDVDLLKLPHCGPVMVDQVRYALRNYLAGVTVKTVEECVHDSGRDYPLQ